MNFRFVLRQLGLLLIVLSLCMLAVTVLDAVRWASRGDESEKMSVYALLMSFALNLVVGCLFWLIGRAEKGAQLGRREALLLVSLSWLFGAAMAGLPFYLWANLGGPQMPGHPFTNFADCYFEAMSGLTTTGATVMGHNGHLIVDLPRGLLLWRSLTHWLGGLGIVVLFVAVLPTLGVGGKRLFQLEVTGPQKKGVRPRISETARALWLIYVGISVICILALRFIGGMGWFDSVCHTFSMVSTGGLSTRDASIGHYNSVAIDIICIIFMFMAGINFALYYQALRGRWSHFWKDTEFRVYLVLKIVVILIVWVNLFGFPITTTAGEEIEGSIGQSLRFGAFQTVALHTGTGYCTADYDPWPFLSLALLVGLMFIGGCAGSTAGGIKVIRFWIALRVIFAELERMFRPKVVRPIRTSRGTIDDETARAAVTYFLLILLLFGLGAVAIQLMEINNEQCDFTTALSASVSTLCNVGPGLHGVGATQNYGWFSSGSKWIFSLLMILGRLEVYAILVLFSPRLWRSD